MAKRANSNLSATALLQTALGAKEAIFSWSKPPLYDHALVQCHRNAKQRGVNAQSLKAQRVWETLKSTSHIGIGVLEADGLVLMRSADDSAAE
jgi:hypothetical protein